MVVGCCGAGKSTVTTTLAHTWDLPVVHLDRLYWKPGWIRSPNEEWERRVRELVAADSWIHDGNYTTTLPLRLPRADLVVFVDTPRRVCLYRALRRRITGNKIHDIPGCPETIDWEFVRYVWRFPKDHRVKLMDKLATHPEVVRLRTRRQVREFLAAPAVRG